MIKIKPIKIGIVSEPLVPYYQAAASTRLRVYDVIKMFKFSTKFTVETYNSKHKYDIVIFMKVFSEDEVELAKKLKKLGTKIVLDININLLDDPAELNKITAFDNEHKLKLLQQRKEILKMIDETTHIIVISPYLLSKYSKVHSHVSLIPESIANDFYQVKKVHEATASTNLLYCGYSAKIDEINNIKDVLIEVNKKNAINLILITDKEIKFDFIKTLFIPYDQKKLPELLLRGDIKIAPRDLDIKYNLGHSMTKVAYPMAVGIPALASPVPSYTNTEVVINEDLDDWYRNLNLYLEDYKLRQYTGERSSEFIKRNFSPDVVKREYIKLFKYVLND